MFSFRLALAAVPAVLLSCSVAQAEDITTLRVSQDGETVASFSLADLDALEQESFETSTIWTDEAVTFSGVSLAFLLAESGVDGQILSMTALNDYAIEMPIEQIGEKFPIIATRMNGKIMSVRDKGPYWIVYPYDSAAEFQTETIYARSVWQLNRLNVIE